MNHNLLNPNTLEHIRIDERTGAASARVPITRLVGNNRLGPAFNVEFVHAGGGWQLAMTRLRSTPGAVASMFELTLADGSTHRIKGTGMVTPMFVIKIERLRATVYHRDGTIEVLKEVGPEPCRADTENIDCKFVSSVGKEMLASLEKRGLANDGSELYYLPVSITSPLGLQLHFNWRIWHGNRRDMTGKEIKSYYQLLSIKDSYRTLMKFAEESIHRPTSFILYPDSVYEKFSYTLSYTTVDKATADAADKDALALHLYGDDKNTKTDLKPSAFLPVLQSIQCATGDMPYTRTFTYDKDGQLSAIAVQLSKSSAEDEIVSSSETLTRDAGKVKTCVRRNGVGLKDETVTYTYATSTTGTITTIEISGRRSSKTVKTFNAEGRQVKEAVTSAGKTRIIEQTITFDENLGRSVGRSLDYLEGAADAQKYVVDWELDRDGNLVRLEQGDVVTEYTYCSTLHFVKQSFEELKKVNEGFLSQLFAPLDPISGAFGNFTWAWEEHRSLSHVATGFSPAKNLFNTPVKLSYPGERQLFDRFVESEVTYRKNAAGGIDKALRAKYYSYAGLAPKTVVGESLTDGKVPVLEYVITVLEPELSHWDISSTRRSSLLDVAGTLAKREIAYYESGHTQPDMLADYLENLKADEIQETFVGLIDPDALGEMNWRQMGQTLQGKIERNIVLLDEQAKRNSIIWALAEKQNARSVITIEKTSYSSAADSYGLPSKIEFYHVDHDYKEIANSRLTTTFTYAYDATLQEFFRKTEVKAADGSVTRDGKRRLACTGSDFRQQETDHAIIEYDRAMDDPNLLTITHNQVVGKNSFTLSKLVTRHQYENTQYHRDESNGEGKETRRTTFDLLGRQTGTSIIRKKDGKETSHVLSSTTYDDSGRMASYALHDYLGDADGLALLSTYSITWTRDAKGTKVVRALHDGTGKELDSVTEQHAPEEAGLSKVTRAGVQFNSQFDAASRATSEWQGDGSSFPYLKTVTTLDPQGAVEKIQYLNVTAKGKSEELASRAVTRDALGRTVKIVQTAASETNYSYDAFGRLTVAESAGVTVCNSYPTTTAVAVATSASITEGDNTVELGTQKHDGFGRVTEETPKGVTSTSFAYETGSRWGREPGAEKRTGHTLEGFSSILDLSTMAYRETCDERVSTSTYSLQGRLMTFKDIAGNETSMTYDIYGRFKRIATDGKAQTLFEYRADGRLHKETVEDLSTGKTMTITFAYDLMGHETSRTFECEGFSKLAIERSLLKDGRLQKSVLKVDGKEYRADEYKYQDCGRLDEWSCSGANPPVSQSGRKYFAQTFTYDPLGDVVKRVNKTSDGDTTSTYTFSDEIPGMLTASDADKQHNDAAGRLTQRAGRKITYFDNGQVKTYSSEPSGTSPVYQFRYDNFGCVRGVTLETDFKETYHYRGNRIYARQQVQSTGNSRLGFHDRTIVLLNESPSCYLQQITTKADLQSSEVVTTTFELRDAAGSIFASLDLSDGNGTITHFSYSPFGYRLPEPKSVTWLGFKGEPLNALSLYHLGNGYRLYDPQLHRFQSPDSWSPFGLAGANEYCYCCSDPVNCHDPSGHLVELWSERRAVEPILDLTSTLTVLINVASVALAPFSAGASAGLAMANTLFATGVAGLSLYSLQLSKSNPAMSMVLDAVLIAVGRGGGSLTSSLSRNARMVGRATAMRSVAVARMRPIKILGKLDDALDAFSGGLWNYGAQGVADTLQAQGGGDPIQRAQWDSPFLTRPDISGRQFVFADDEYLAMTHVDQFLKKSPPLRDAIAKAWGSDESIDVVAVMTNYLKNAGTAGMFNQSPLSPEHKVLHDVAMYGLVHNDKGGMYCRGNSVAIVSDQLGDGFVPFSRRQDTAL
ncbi:RHS repeat-associated core domain-containing protein [Pseudomonas sp. zfem002]|uniref:RHS repeat domain-containing protein n=1 Tax=Pseudomonas sp. zfem002 TaxID=3078197 RepID=UPI0029276C72|nr:RHS repeat-associated core domain-containing protein [Pseudomonas sp. zfem002]MDU9389145.1 RHS repeat-associated core domain-containing protein [Pseudomonas sp. zfem002]